MRLEHIAWVGRNPLTVVQSEVAAWGVLVGNINETFCGWLQQCVYMHKLALLCTWIGSWFAGDTPSRSTERQGKENMQITKPLREHQEEWVGGVISSICFIARHPLGTVCRYSDMIPQVLCVYMCVCGPQNSGGMRKRGVINTFVRLLLYGNLPSFTLSNHHIHVDEYVPLLLLFLASLSYLLHFMVPLPGA